MSEADASSSDVELCERHGRHGVLQLCVSATQRSGACTVATLSSLHLVPSCRSRERGLGYRTMSLSGRDHLIRCCPFINGLIVRSSNQHQTHATQETIPDSAVLQRIGVGAMDMVAGMGRVGAVDGASPACGDGGGETVTTAIGDLPADVLALVLRRLDGASLAALGCACSAFRGLASDQDTWRRLCLAMWPSVRDVTPCCRGGGHRALFADAFPFPAPPPAPPVPGSLPTRLVSAVDLHHAGDCIMSRVVETDASSDWFLGSPFRVDALVQEGFSAPSPINPGELTLSWILIDPATGRAVNASSRRPVSVDRKWLTGDTVARFSVVLGDVALDAAVTCDDRYGHVREVSLCIEDGSVGGGGGGVSGRDGLATVAAAMTGARQSRAAGEAEARARYEEFVKRKRARKEWKARREGIVDLCCSGVGAAAFVGFLVMLTFR
ncbi:hypothetical protein ACP70R_021930 [Stipagrostis hirtigluma subsp. patula]